MRSTYGYLLALPGAGAMSLAALVARLPLSMAALGIVLVVAERTGSYAAAGLVSASHVIAAAISAPVQGRLGDRVGQARVLVVVGAGYAVGMTVLITAILTDASPPLPHLAAFAAGAFSPQAGSFVRARWTHVLAHDRTRLTTAFAVEAVLDEVVFVVGPVLVTFLTLQVDQMAGLAVSTTAAALGSWALAAQRGTAPPGGRTATSARAAMGWGVLGPVLVASVAIGVLFGSVEVVVVAFSEEQGRAALAGAVLAAFAGGSLVAGVVVGALPAPADPVRRLRWTILALGVLFAPLLAADSMPWLFLGMFATGVMISPALIAATSVIEQHVAPSRLTEALSWTSLGLAVGVAPGAALVGAVVDTYGASAGFAVPLVAGLAAAVVAFTFDVPKESPEGFARGGHEH